ncbi:hypothetical protein MMC20_007973 [Loxospora ochrophaea]|nr:hypothetical protein [Loxospora ochrophaea]
MYLSLAALLLLPSSVVAEVVTTTIVAGSSTPTNSPSYTSDTDFVNAVLNSTNLFRDQHNATAVIWNQTLADYAAKYANNCQFQHSGGPYGENLAEGYANITSAIDAWGDERALYNFNDPGFSEQTGHFTQLVWKNTSSTGCGRVFCNGKNNVAGWYLVCEYYPRGNVGGEYATEVQSQIKGGTQQIQGGISAATRSRGQGMAWMVLIVAAAIASL